MKGNFKMGNKMDKGKWFIIIMINIRDNFMKDLNTGMAR